MLGASGFAILLVFGIAGAAILSVILLTVLSDYMLMAFENTATGEDAVPPLSDAVIEVVWKPVYLLGMLVPTFVPVAVIMVLIAPGLAADIRGLLVIVAALVWVFFPVLLISSYFSGRWLAVQPSVVAGMLINGRATLTFYGLSGVVLGAATVSSVLGINGGVLEVLAAGVVGGAAPLLYGRLLGRLAFLLENPLRRRKAKKRPRKPKPKPLTAIPVEPMLDTEMPSEHIMAASPQQIRHPTAIPFKEVEEEEDEYARYKKPYGVMSNAEVEVQLMKMDSGDPGVIGKLTDLPPLGVKRLPAPDPEEGKGKRFHSITALFFRRVWTYPCYGGNPTRWANVCLLLIAGILLAKLIRFVWTNIG